MLTSHLYLRKDRIKTINDKLGYLIMLTGYLSHYMKRPSD